MNRSLSRWLLALTVPLALASSTARTARGDTPREVPKDFSAELVCRAERTYVLCLVPVSPPLGWRLNFAEINLLKEPSFLKSVATRATYKPETQRKPNLKLGFVTKQAGTGEISVQARALLCSESNGWCDHLAKVITTSVTVPP
ncbi:MAG TPA: hypothetical protein VHB79_03365 [Polyangiaceae bacterium]|nr:hypothetical protein [Polyangiaceae bacterium]